MISIYRITDFAVAMAILDEPEIAKHIYEDTAPFIIPDLISEFWLGAQHESNVIGCYRVHKMGAVLYQVHARILPKYRKYSIEASTALLRYCAKNIDGFENMMCYVPTIHENVKNHAMAVGFEVVGHIPHSYLKNGKVIGQDILSITKEKILCQQQPSEQ